MSRPEAHPVVVATYGFLIAVEAPSGTPVEDVKRAISVLKDHPVLSFDIEFLGEIDVYDEAGKPVPAGERDFPTS